MTFMGAIKQLHELQNAEDMPFYYKPAIAEVINVLLMDAQEVRHGHWVKKWNTFFKQDVWHCDVCEKESPLKYDYCPCCGAKMDEVTENA